MVSAPQTFAAALQEKKETSRREAVIKSVQGSYVDVQPIGSGTVLADVQWSGGVSPIAGTRCSIEKIKGRYTAFIREGTAFTGDGTGSSAVFTTIEEGDNISLFTHALNDTGVHTGTLNDSQAPQFFKLDGTRDLTGGFVGFSGLGRITKAGVGNLTLSAASTAFFTITGAMTKAGAGGLTISNAGTSNLNLTGDLTKSGAGAFTIGAPATAATVNFSAGGTLDLAGYTITAPASGTIVLGAGTISTTSVNNATITNHTHDADTTDLGVGDKIVQTNTFGDITAGRYLTATGNVYSKGGAGGFVFEDSTNPATNSWKWYGSGLVGRLSLNGTDKLTVNNLGNTVVTGTFNATGQIKSNGSASEITWDDRLLGSTHLWSWQSSNGVTTLVNASAGIRVTVAESGNTTIAGSVTETGLVNALGGSAGYQMDDQSGGSTPSWKMSATGGSLIFRKNDVGDLATISSAGNVSATKFLAGGVTTSLAGSFHGRSTTQPQLQLEYNSTTANRFSISVESNGDTNLVSGGALLKFPTTNRLQSTNYASQTTGWGITGLGAADFRYLYTDELHARKFVADTEFAFAGIQGVFKSFGELSKPFTAPAAGGTATLWVRDMKGSPNVAVFESGDFVNVRNWDRSAGGLSIADCWGIVTAYTDGTSTNDGQQSWTFTRSTSTNAGSMVSTTVVPAESVVIDAGSSIAVGGVVQGGYYEVNAIDGLYADNSPYMQIVKWVGHPATGKFVALRTGNLKGIFSVNGEYGMYAGTGVTNADQYIRASSYAFELRNIDMNIYDGSNLAFKINRQTPYMAMGSIAPSTFLGGDGFWLGKSSGAYKFHLGTVTSGNLTAGLSWNGSTLRIMGSAYIGNGVGFSLAPVLYLPFTAAPGDTAPNLNGHLGQKPFSTKGVSAMAGRYGSGAAGFGGTATNLVLNPHFAHATYGTGYAAQGTNAVTAASTDAYYGQTAMKVTYTGTNFRWVRAALTRTSTSNNASGYMIVRCIGGTAQLQIGIYNSGLTTGVTSGYVSVGSSWTVLRIQATAAQLTTATVGTTCSMLLENNGDNGTTKVVVIGFAQFEETLYSTPPVSGDFGPGFSWAGTAHNSTSSRTTASVAAYTTFPQTVSRRGSASMWVQGVQTSLQQVLLDSRSSTNTGSWRLFIDAGVLKWRDGASADILSYTLPATNYGQHYHVGVTYDFDTGSYALYWEGEQVATATSATWGLPGWISVGNAYASTIPANAVISDFVLADRIIQTDEFKSIYGSGAPVSVSRSNHEFVLSEYGVGSVVGNAGGIIGTLADGTNSFALMNATKGVGSANQTLDAGDILIGDNDSGQANLFYDESAGALYFRVGTGTTYATITPSGATFTGSVTITGSFTGVNYAGSASAGGAATSIVGQGALATASSASWGSQVSGRPTELTDGRIATALNASGVLVTRVVPAVNATPSGTGLYLGADFMGYYASGAWRTYMANNGDFFLKGTSSFLQWDNSTGKLGGYSTAGIEAWSTDATTGAINAGRGALVLSYDGIEMDEGAGMNLGDLGRLSSYRYADTEWGSSKAAVLLERANLGANVVPVADQDNWIDASETTVGAPTVIKTSSTFNIGGSIPCEFSYDSLKYITSGTAANVYVYWFFRLSFYTSGSSFISSADMPFIPGISTSYRNTRHQFTTPATTGKMKIELIVTTFGATGTAAQVGMAAKRLAVRGYTAVNSIKLTDDGIDVVGHMRFGATGLNDANSVSATNWFRSTGGTGWINTTYGGGWHMQDTNYIRAYGGKTIYTAGRIRADAGYDLLGLQVVGARKTGWSLATGTATRTTFATTTVTLAQLAERVKALIDDLHSTAGHGLITT